jgi:hypothetical protein
LIGAAEQFVGRAIARLARNVPQREVDAGHGMRTHADTAVVIGRVEHAISADVDGQRVEAHEGVGEAVANLVGERGLDDGLDHGGG